MFLKYLVYVALAYGTHLALQKLYYEHCTHNLFLVVFFKNSTFCTTMESVIVLLEGGFANIVRSLVKL